MIRKTAAVTAASIAGVIMAGGAAVGANIGILNTADSSELGQLSAEAPIDTTPQVLTVDSSPESNIQSFAVDVAGTVSVETTGSGLRLGEARANPGWTWEDTTSSADSVSVTFTSGSDTLEFVAALKADGTIESSVIRPATSATTQPPTVSSNTPAPSFSEDGDDHGADDEPEGHESDEHEGREDDD